jgi:acyl carrier protein
MREVLLETRLRRLVAESLGVDFDDLTPEVSLTDDLAADSLDLLELVLALEEELGISVPEGVLAEVHTYGDLVQATTMLARGHRGGLPTFFRARITSVDGPPGSSLDRSGRLTPYMLQELAEDALRAGRGARLELAVPAGTEEAELLRLRRHLHRLDGRGVTVDVRRDREDIGHSGERAA